MTTAPEPDPTVPASPVDLSGLVDRLEERVADGGDADAGEDSGDDVQPELPGAAEPPD